MPDLMDATHLIRSLFVLAALGLGACAAVGPDYTPPVTEVPASWNRLDPAAHPVMHAAAADDLSRWWRRLDDPLLSELVMEALRANLDLRGAQARLRAARARRAVASAAFFPTLDSSVSGSHSRSSKETGSGKTYELYNAGFDAGWELDVFGGLRRGAEAVGADLESSEASLQETGVSLAAEVALNYVEVRTLHIRLEIARDNLASQTETLQLTEWRAQAGIVSSQDVEQARSNREQTRAQIPLLEIALAEAEHRLDLLLDKAPGTLHARLAGGDDLPRVPERIAVGIPADALRRRPDVRAAERTLAAETARVGAAEAARYPAFNLSGSLGLEALSPGALDSGSAATSALRGLVIAPIFNAGRLRSQVEIQDAVREQALVAYEQSVLSALQEVENALVALARSGERTEALAIAAESANNAAELARQRYTAGLIDFQSVLDTERSVRTVEDALASSRADRLLALIRLYKALGGGWSPDERYPADREMP